MLHTTPRRRYKIWIKESDGSEVSGIRIPPGNRNKHKKRKLRSSLRTIGRFARWTKRHPTLAQSE